VTQEDIIRMAREAGFNLEQGFLLRVTGIDEDLERFAALVAAAEREACAQIAEEWLGPTKDRELHIAAAIRARGQDPMPLFDDWPGGWKK
jgi:hypothetical protein